MKMSFFKLIKMGVYCFPFIEILWFKIAPTLITTSAKLVKIFNLTIKL